MEALREGFEAAGTLTAVAIVSLLLIALGLVYFMVTLWTVKTGAGILGLSPDANWTVLSAAVIAAASMVGSGRRA